ncbi:hypothetical protein NL676_038347 [Syzygium grande]|nr:hypothetical protein NL676_038347 [Syzygium grande]
MHTCIKSDNFQANDGIGSGRLPPSLLGGAISAVLLALLLERPVRDCQRPNTLEGRRGVRSRSEGLSGSPIKRITVPSFG